jgi:D-glycero-D-manno-heptose 1,7-bisphosphate phosphatase
VSRPAAFLDRDGVLNAPIVRDGLPYPPAGVSDLELLPRVEESCRALREAGLALVVVTNQPDIARGAVSEADVTAINTRLRAMLSLEDVVVCPHDDRDGCACRKPKPGMILQAAARHDLDLSRSVMVGDRWRDVAAGKAAGTRTVFVDRGYDESMREDPDLTITELYEAIPWVIRAAQPHS